MLKDYHLSKRINHTHDLKRQQCFTNAVLLSLGYGWDYVEGYLKVHGVPIEHAWNLVDGQIVDGTLVDDPPEWYYTAFALESKQVEFFNKHSVAGPFWRHKSEWSDSMQSILKEFFGS